MGTIDNIIKAEIIRLAKREARKLTSPLREEIKRLKKHDVERRRQLDMLAMRLQQQQAQDHLKTKTAQAATGEIKGRMSPKLIKSLRKKLGISQGALAQLLSVSTVTIGSWEKGKSAPKPAMKAKLLSFRGMKRREVKLLMAGLDSKPGKGKMKPTRAKAGRANPAVQGGK